MHHFKKSLNVSNKLKLKTIHYTIMLANLIPNRNNLVKRFAIYKRRSLVTKAMVLEMPHRMSLLNVVYNSRIS